MIKKIMDDLGRRSNKKILGIGHSHILAIHYAAEPQKEQLRNLHNLDLRIVWLGDDRYKDFRIHKGNTGVEGFVWSQEIEQEINNLNSKSDILFSVFGGNAHNIFGMVQHPTPFDFILSTEPDLFLCQKAELVPEAIIELALTSQGGFPETIWCLRAARDKFLGRIVHIESPPPIKDAEYLRDHAGAFEESFATYGISPEILRYKLWRLHSRLIKAECDRLDIEFIESPTIFVDKDGFLSSSGYSMDTTHANVEYGNAVIQQLTSLN